MTGHDWLGLAIGPLLLTLPFAFLIWITQRDIRQREAEFEAKQEERRKRVEQ